MTIQAEDIKTVQLLPPDYTGHQNQDFPTRERTMHTSALSPRDAPSSPTPMRESIRDAIFANRAQISGRGAPEVQRNSPDTDASWSQPSARAPPDLPSTVGTWEKIRVLREVLLGRRHGVIAPLGRFHARVREGPLLHLQLAKALLRKPHQT